MTAIKQLHRQLTAMERSVIELASLATESIEQGTTALLLRDFHAAESVIARDILIDQGMRAIESRVATLLAFQDRDADPALLIGVLRIVHEIERIGDNMVNVAKASYRLDISEVDHRVRSIIQKMCKQATVQLAAAITAFAERDLVMAESIDIMDDAMDDLQRELLAVIFASELQDNVVKRSVEIALVGRYFERIADHATNFGSRVSSIIKDEVVITL